MSSPGFVLFGALAVIVGALIPVQAATNAAMSRAIGSVAITSLALFAIGFVVIAAWAIVISDDASFAHSRPGTVPQAAGRR